MSERLQFKTAEINNHATGAGLFQESRLNELHLFAGAGGGILRGHTCVCAVEIDPYCRAVLLQRQRDGMLPRFPIWDDIRTFDGRPWRGLVHIVCGGFPCQDISVAGRGAGIDGDQSGLWREMARVVREVGPEFVQVENSPMLTIRGLGTVLRDLATMGYNAKWGVLGGFDAGMETQGDRIWIIAQAARHRSQVLRAHEVANDYPAQPRQDANELDATSNRIKRLEQRLCERALRRTPYWVANRMDRFKAVGNGQIPALVALAWQILQPRRLTVR